MKISEANKKFLKSKNIKNISKSTIRMYISILDNLKKHFNDCDINDITIDNLLDFIQKNFRKSGSPSVGTVRLRAILLKQYFKFFGLVKLSDKIPLPIGNGKYIRPLELDEFNYILENKCDDDRDTAILWLMVSSGLRAGEVINLKVKHIDFDKKIMHVWGKGVKPEEEPDVAVFNEQAKASLEKYLGDRINIKDSFVFLSNGKKFKYWPFWKMFKEKFGVRPHQLRHTFCTIYSDKLTPIELQTLARHKNFNTTRRYINPEREKTIREYRKIEDI